MNWNAITGVIAIPDDIRKRTVAAVLRNRADTSLPIKPRSVFSSARSHVRAYPFIVQFYHHGEMSYWPPKIFWSKSSGCLLMKPRRSLGNPRQPVSRSAYPSTLTEGHPLHEQPQTKRLTLRAGASEDGPAAVRDVFARIADFGGDNKRVAVAGDSAGGNLAAFGAKRGGELRPTRQRVVPPCRSARPFRTQNRPGDTTMVFWRRREPGR